MYDGMFYYRRDGGNYLEPGVLGIILHLDEGILISTISINCSNHAFCSVPFDHRKSIQSKLRCNTAKRRHCNHCKSVTLKTKVSAESAYSFVYVISGTAQM